jgi:hypothetical protein
MVHEGGWTLVLHADRTITLRRPDGTIHHHGTTINATGTTAPRPHPPPGQSSAA